VFTRIPWAAYSMASERVADSMPPLMRTAKADGTPAIGCVASEVPMLTMCPACYATIRRSPPRRSRAPAMFA
jgi:hypothetical protein